MGQVRLGDSAWLISWVPTGEKGCKGYAQACQCNRCQANDRKLPDEPLSEGFRAEVLGTVEGDTPARFVCHGYENVCICGRCKPRAERLEQRRELDRIEPRETRELRQMMQSNRGIPGA